VTAPPRYTVVTVVDVPPDGVAAFQRYEDEVLPLLHRYDGLLERRLRSPEGTTGRCSPACLWCSVVESLTGVP
jgi:hypothetical protein